MNKQFFGFVLICLFVSAALLPAFAVEVSKATAQFILNGDVSVLVDVAECAAFGEMGDPPDLLAANWLDDDFVEEPEVFWYTEEGIAKHLDGGKETSWTKSMEGGLTIKLSGENLSEGYEIYAQKSYTLGTIAKALARS